MDSSNQEKPQIIQELFDAHCKSNTHCLVAHQQSQNFISSGSKGNIFVWNKNTKRHMKCLSAHTNSCPIRGLANYMPNGLISANRDSRVIIWNLKSGQISQILRDHQYAVQSVSILKNQNLIVTGGQDCKIIIRSLRTFEILQSFSLLDQKQGNLFLGIGDTLLIAASDFNLHAVTLKTQKSKVNLQNEQHCIVNAHTFHISCLQHEPGTQNFYTSSLDNTIKKWVLKEDNVIQNLYEIQIDTDCKVYNIIPIVHQMAIVFSCENNGWFKYSQHDQMKLKLRLGFQTFGFFSHCFLKNQSELAFITGDRNIHILGRPSDEDQEYQQDQQGLDSTNKIKAKELKFVKRGKINNILDLFF